MIGKIVAVCISSQEGTKKCSVEAGRLITGHGLIGDAHAGPWQRQVSLLAQESVDKMRAKGLTVGPGSFAENLTTEGINLPLLALGQRLRVGKNALLEITQIGKECHTRCAIYYQAGDCVMPREGVFAQVVKGGEVRPGDIIEVVKRPNRRPAADGHQTRIS